MLVFVVVLWFKSCLSVLRYSWKQKHWCQQTDLCPSKKPLTSLWVYFHFYLTKPCFPNYSPMYSIIKTPIFFCIGSTELWYSISPAAFNVHVLWPQRRSVVVLIWFPISKSQSVAMCYNIQLKYVYIAANCFEVKAPLPDLRSKSNMQNSLEGKRCDKDMHLICSQSWHFRFDPAVLTAVNGTKSSWSEWYRPLKDPDFSWIQRLLCLLNIALNQLLFF